MRLSRLCSSRSMHTSVRCFSRAVICGHDTQTAFIRQIPQLFICYGQIICILSDLFWSQRPVRPQRSAPVIKTCPGHSLHDFQLRPADGWNRPRSWHHFMSSGNNHLSRTHPQTAIRSYLSITAISHPPSSAPFFLPLSHTQIVNIIHHILGHKAPERKII